MVSYPGQIPGNAVIGGDLSVGDDATIAGDATVAGTLTVAPGGVLQLGADVSIYRQAADVLRSDDYTVLSNGGQSNADWYAYTGNAKALVAGTAGGGLAIAEGANARSGRLVLNGATPVVVPNTSVTADTEIQLTHNIPGGTPAFAWVSARNPGVSFTVTGTAGDTSTVAFFLVEPA